MHGEEMNLPSNMLLNTHPTGNTDVDTMLQSLRQSLERATQYLQESQQVQERNANRHRRDVQFSVGDYVWLSTENLHQRHGTRKLHPRYIGPFRITRSLENGTYELNRTGALANTRIHNRFHVSKLRPFSQFDRFTREENEYPPVSEWEQDSRLVFEVDHIVAHRVYYGKYQYLVRWYGYSEEHDSWEPLDKLRDTARDRVAHYHVITKLPLAVLDDTQSQTSSSARSTGARRTNTQRSRAPRTNKHDTASPSSAAPRANTTAARTRSQTQHITMIQTSYVNDTRMATLMAALHL